MSSIIQLDTAGWTNDLDFTDYGLLIIHLRVKLRRTSRLLKKDSPSMSRRKRTKGPLTPVNEVLNSVMTGLEMPEDIELKGKVFLAWEEAVGDVAAHTHPFRFRGSTLLVEVDEPAWLTELSMRKTEIVNRLERAVGEKVVEDIRFEIKKKRREE